MNEAKILKAEQMAKDKGYSSANLYNFMQGFSEGYNHFKKTIKDSEAHKEGYEAGAKEFARLEAQRTRRELNALNKQKEGES